MDKFQCLMALREMREDGMQPRNGLPGMCMLSTIYKGAWQCDVLFFLSHARLLHGLGLPLPSLPMCDTEYIVIHKLYHDI
jgi:hypothetical protein